MNDPLKKEKEPELTIEDRLKGIAYQFITLYDRWREDRQIAAKKDAEIAELAQQFAQQVKQFNTIGEEVRNSIIETFNENMDCIQRKTVTQVKEEAQNILGCVAERLSEPTQKAIQALNDSQQIIVERSNFRVVSVWLTAISVGVLSGFFILKWFMPTPTLPLTDHQVYELDLGRTLYFAEQKMPKKELDRIWKLATEAENSKDSNDL